MISAVLVQHINSGLNVKYHLIVLSLNFVASPDLPKWLLNPWAT